MIDINAYYEIRRIQSIMTLGFDQKYFGKSDDNDYKIIIKDHPEYIKYIENLSKDVIFNCIDANIKCFEYIPKSEIDLDLYEYIYIY